MAITLEANYSKKIGLPGYSSHQYGVTVKAELSDMDRIPEESERVYQMLQDAVDREIQSTGWLPGNGDGGHNGNGNGNGHAGNGSGPPQSSGSGGWTCSPKQRELILKIIGENDIDKHEVENLARERFGKGVRALNRLEASGLIDELFETYATGRRKADRANGRRTRAPAGKGGGR